MKRVKAYVLYPAGYGSSLSRYESEPDDTYIAYPAIPTLSSRGDYFRIRGPSVWIK